jgi:hypothetical protein
VLPVLFVRQVLVFAYVILHLLGVWIMENTNENAISTVAVAMQTIVPGGSPGHGDQVVACLLRDRQIKDILTLAE